MASSKNYQIRSISLPSRSHPSTAKVDEELSKIKTSSSSSSATTCSSHSIGTSLSLLEELYLSLEEFLNMSSTQKVISQHQGEKCVEEVLDGSVKILDICGITRDSIFQLKECVQSLHSSLRRRKGDSSIEKSVLEYHSFTKKMKKNAKNLITSLKQMDGKFGVSPLLDLEDDHLGAVIRVLREAILMNLCVFQSLLSFLTFSSSKSKSTKWLVLAKLMHKGVIASSCEDHNSVCVNELQCVDASLSTLLIEGAINANGDKLQGAHEKLEALENVLEGFENGLESVFRRLIKTRATLLNIISQ